MTHYKAVLMDLDQTLIDSRQSILRSFEHAFQQVLGVSVAPERILAMWGHPIEKQMMDLAGAAAADQLVAAFRAHLLTQDHLISLFPGWMPVLATLRQRGYRLAVVTSKKRAMAERHMALVGIDKMIDWLVGADDVVNHKPDPEPFLLAAAQVGVLPGHCIAVGDSPWDVIGARRAGMAAALAEWDRFDAGRSAGVNGEPLAIPDYRLAVPADLLPICPAIPNGLAACDPGQW